MQEFLEKKEEKLCFTFDYNSFLQESKKKKIVINDCLLIKKLLNLTMTMTKYTALH
jgi:hypothetical protein